mmetsp:Transcript_21/g.49  ORF Transcript_21/g.49 Transcript_21/m.49 type:complete len:112 (+) Transcript_21:76-411(+)
MHIEMIRRTEQNNETIGRQPRVQSLLVDQSKKMERNDRIHYHLRNPRFRKRIPITVSNIFSRQSNSIFKRNTIPSGLHEVSNVLVGIAVGVGEDIPVVLSPELEGGVLVEI